MLIPESNFAFTSSALIRGTSGKYSSGIDSVSEGVDVGVGLGAGAGAGVVEDSFVEQPATRKMPKIRIMLTVKIFLSIIVL